MVPAWQYRSPQALLGEGGGIYTNEDQVRVFFIRKVVYDDGMTPLYSVPSIGEYENTYLSLEELRKAHPAMEDTNVLDYDNKYTLWHEKSDHKEEVKENQ